MYNRRIYLTYTARVINTYFLSILAYFKIIQTSSTIKKKIVKFKKKY